MNAALPITDSNAQRASTTGVFVLLVEAPGRAAFAHSMFAAIRRLGGAETAAARFQRPHIAQKAKYNLDQHGEPAPYHCEALEIANHADFREGERTTLGKIVSYADLWQHLGRYGPLIRLMSRIGHLPKNVESNRNRIHEVRRRFCSTDSQVPRT